MGHNYQDLTTYVRHTVGGKTMRELARGGDVEASTVMRRVRRVEDLREWPEWDVLLDQLALVTCPDGVTDEAILTAMGLERQEAEALFIEAMTSLEQSGAVVAVTDGPVACVFLDGEVAYRTTRCAVTAWLGLGWIEGKSNGRVRRYAPSGKYGQEPEEPKSEKRARPYALYTHGGSENINYMRQMRTGNNRSRFGFTPEQVGLAIDLSTLMTAAVTRGAGSPELERLVQIKERIGEELFDVLYDFLHAGVGLEKIETDRGWCARSAKVVLSIALKQVAHFKLDEGLWLIGAEPKPEAAAATAGKDGRPVRSLHAAE